MTLNLIQITDTHVHRRPHSALGPVDVDVSLERVLRHVRARGTDLDLILATGDMVQEEHPDAYANLRRHLLTLGTPVYCLPGNHDDIDLLPGLCRDAPIHWQRRVERAPWQIVMLDSTLRNSAAGHLAASELEALEDTLSAHPQLHTIVCLHHQPVPIGSTWLDTMTVDNADALLSVIDAHKQVKGVLFGHIHQEFEYQHGNTPILGTPSTCVQFKPGTAQAVYDDLAPGYRWLTLHPNGELETGVVRVPG